MEPLRGTNPIGIAEVCPTIQRKTCAVVCVKCCRQRCMLALAPGIEWWARLCAPMRHMRTGVSSVCTTSHASVLKRVAEPGLVWYPAQPLITVVCLGHWALDIGYRVLFFSCRCAVEGFWRARRHVVPISGDIWNNFWGRLHVC